MGKFSRTIRLKQIITGLSEKISIIVDFNFVNCYVLTQVVIFYFWMFTCSHTGKTIWLVSWRVSISMSGELIIASPVPSEFFSLQINSTTSLFPHLFPPLFQNKQKEHLLYKSNEIIIIKRLTLSCVFIMNHIV